MTAATISMTIQDLIALRLCIFICFPYIIVVINVERMNISENRYAHSTEGP